MYAYIIYITNLTENLTLMMVNSNAAILMVWHSNGMKDENVISISTVSNPMNFLII